MMQLNALEGAVLLLWPAGVVAVLATGAARGFHLRTWLALAAAILVPVLGAVLAFAFAFVSLRAHTARDLGSTP